MTDRESPIPDEMLSAYLDGELSAQEQAQVARALAQDEQLRLLFEELRQLRIDIRSLPKRQLPSGFSSRVLLRVEPKPPSAHKGRQSTASVGRRRIITTLLATAATLTIALWAVLPRNQDTASRQVARIKEESLPTEHEAVASADAASPLDSLADQRLLENLSASGAAGPTESDALELPAMRSDADSQLGGASAADAPRFSISIDKASTSPRLAATLALTLSPDQSNQFKARISSQQRPTATTDEGLVKGQMGMQTVDISDAGGANIQQYFYQDNGVVDDDDAEYVVVDGTAEQFRDVLAAVPPSSQQILQLSGGLTAATLGIASATEAPRASTLDRWERNGLEPETLVESSAATRGRRLQQARPVSEPSGQILVAPNAEAANSRQSLSTARPASNALAEAPGAAGARMGGFGGPPSTSVVPRGLPLAEKSSAAPRDLVEADRADAAAPRYRVLFLLRRAE